ncbi:hypothetical protein H4R19_004987 [Coemansia spiralis]|nr:hypothetical protein H4R19_004987 [Coemansia spiralis]
MYEHDASNSGIVTANRMLAESNCHNMSKLVINGMDAIPPELIAYTGLTHLDLNGPTNADDVMVLIHRMPRLMSLSVISLNLADAQTDFSIPQRAEHEPVVPLNTQIKTLAISPFDPRESNLTLSMLKYLMLRTPTLKSVTAAFAPVEEIQAFIDEYVLWYPHLANIELVR